VSVPLVSAPGGGRVRRVAAELVRPGVAVAAAIILQTTVAPNMRIMGANPDLALIVVACIGLLRGAEVGAAFGFVTGALVSSILLEPLGVNSFVFVLVGYFAGRYAETADLQSGFAPAVTVFMAALLAQTMFALVQFLLERQVPVGFVIGQVIVPAVILDTLLAVPIYIVIAAGLGKERSLGAYTTS